MIKRTLGLIGILLLVANLQAQTGDIYFSGRFINSAFTEFIAQIEHSTGAKFYYQDEWIDSVRITADGDSLSLQEVLRRNLTETNLHFYITPAKTVFITEGDQLITKIPVVVNREKVFEYQRSKNGNGKTEIEKMYLERHENGLSETKILGHKKASFQNKTEVITGEINDVETGEALIGATLYIQETGKACVTDLNGHYSIALKQGKYNASINCLGMKEIKYILEVYSSAGLNIEMEKTLIPINEVTVTADRYHNVKGMIMGFERISIKETQSIPLVLGEKDILKVATMLPGVQNVGEGAAGLNVRGSAADQNMFYMNKVPVYNTAHLFGFFSSFSPDIIKDFSFYKSSLPAKYGGRLSSFFDITAKEGNKKKYTARGGISPITGHISVEGPIVKDKSSFVIAARSTYSDWLLTRLHDADLRNSKARFHDFAASVSLEHNENNISKIFGYYSFDKFSLAQKNHYEYSNAGVSISWWHRYSNRHSSETSLIFSDYQNSYQDRVNSISAYKQEYSLKHAEFKWDFSFLPFANHTIKYGLDLIRYQLDRGTIEPVGAESNRKLTDLGVENGMEGALYLSDEYRIAAWLTLYAGIRYSYFTYLGPKTVFEYEAGSPKTEQYIINTSEFNRGQRIKDYSGPEYRATANFRTGLNSSVKLSYNRTRQYLFMLTNTIAISPTDQWKLCDYNIIPPLSDQVSAGFYLNIIKPGIDVSTEVYYKQMDHVIQYKDGANLISNKYIERDVLPGNQEAYGIELMLRKNSGKLTGWLSYCYSRSFITVDGEYDWQQINNGMTFPSNYDKPHAFNGIVNYKVNRRLSFSLNAVYSTGRPVTYPLAVFYINGMEQAYYSDRNSYRIPDYFRLDFSANLEGNLFAKKLAHSYFMLNVYNLTGRKNTYSVYFRTEEGRIQGYKMSVFGVPILTVSWNFKFGNYASD